MHSSIMYELHIVSISVHVNNPVKYSVYLPIVGEVCCNAEVMKCYFLPLSQLLALFPLFCRWSATVVSAALLIPELDTLGGQAWICLITHFHFLFLDVPTSRRGRKPMTGNNTGYYYSFTNIGAADWEEKCRCLKSTHCKNTHIQRNVY